MRDQGRDIFLAIAQRGEPKVHDVEPVKQIAAERALFHFLRQVAIGGGDNAEVRPAMRERTHRAKLLLLQNAQQLGLEVERQLADLVKERRATVGHFDQAGLRSNGAGECPFDVAEQLALHERAHQGGTIDGDKRAYGLNLMYGARHHFLAGTGFAEQQDRPTAAAQLLYHPQDISDAWRLADQEGSGFFSLR